MRRSFHLQTTSSALDDSRDHDRDVHGRARVVGSSNGRFAVAIDQERVHCGVTALLSCCTEWIFVLDPGADNGNKEVELAAPIVAAPIASRGPSYVYVHKVVFAPGSDDGTIVALYDHKNVAYIDISTSHQKWTNIDLNMVHNLADLAFDNDGKLYCLDSYGGVHVVRIPRGGHNESAVVESLPAAAFAPPYDIGSALATTKYIFFCHGSLYQVWQNKSATAISRGFTMPVEKILVLRYDPRRSPCWDAVKDLGGCSVFIGKSNNPVVVRAASGVPGVRADCVYWIDWIRPMECDIATGTSKKYVLPYGACIGNCWYFSDDDMTCIKREKGEKLNGCVSVEMIVID